MALTVRLELQSEARAAMEMEPVVLWMPVGSSSRGKSSAGLDDCGEGVLLRAILVKLLTGSSTAFWCWYWY